MFEGIRIYRTSPGKYLALAMNEHLDRLDRSWHALSLPVTYSNDAIRPALSALLNEREVGDCYCRVTRFLDLPDADTGAEADSLIVALYQSAQLLGKPVSCITSSWRRNEFATPAQMKIGGHYFMLSWIRQQARRLGADDAILLNQNDFVAEATGTGVFIFTGGMLVTPPINDGALPSITVRIVRRLADRLGIPTSIRSIHRTELFSTEAAFLAGTLDELRPITSIDGVGIPSALSCKPVADVFKAFAEMCRSEIDHGWGELLKASSE
jgi:branched-chain amino acid aminotransferase